MTPDEERRLIAAQVKAWLRAALIRTGWSAEEWGRRSGVASTTITRTMAGDGQIPNFYSLWRLARAADLPLPDATRPVVPLVDWGRYARAGINASYDGHGEIWSPERSVRLAVRLERRWRGFLAGDILYLRLIPDGEVEDGFYTLIHDHDGRQLVEVRSGWMLPLHDGGLPERLSRVRLCARLAGVYSTRP